MELLTKYDFLKLFDENDDFLADKQTRQIALDFYHQNEIPTQKTEKYKHTALQPLLKQNYKAASKHPDKTKILDEIVSSLIIKELEGSKLVFINGFLSERHSKIRSETGIEINSQAKAKSLFASVLRNNFEFTGIYKDSIFSALNTGYSKDGAFINIEGDHEIDNPVQIIHISDGTADPVLSLPRNLFVMGENCKVKIIETFHSIGQNACFTDSCTEIIVQENAKVELYSCQNLDTNGLMVNHSRVFQNPNSYFRSFTFTINGQLIRNDLVVEHGGKNCQTELIGLYLPNKEQHFDNYIWVNHSFPNSTSNQLYKGVLNDKGSAVFCGRIYVAKGAQKTSAYQSNRNILLSETAKVNSKPQLEIYADDVKCSHGSATGQMDKEALFYLRSRGISLENARLLLVNAFISEVLDKIEIQPIRQRLEDEINIKMKF